MGIVQSGCFGQCMNPSVSQVATLDGNIPNLLTSKAEQGMGTRKEEPSNVQPAEYDYEQDGNWETYPEVHVRYGGG